MVHLLVSPPDTLRFEVAIERPKIVIGRSSRADISVSDPSLSRSHAELSLKGDSWTVKDLGSRNGTRVNGKLISEDTFGDEHFREADSLLDAGVRSLVAAPMLGPDESLGMIVLSSSAENRAFTEDDMELLASLASVAAMRVQNLQLAEAEGEHRRHRREIGLARRIQVALLPSELPSIPGYDLHAGNRPSEGVSGDYYEVLTRKNGAEVLMMVVDVSGAGVGASLLMGALESLAASPIENGWPPEAICTTVSRLLYERTPPEKYATAFLGVLEPDLGFLRFTNAGHFPALVIRDDGTTTQLHSTGLPLGLFPEVDFGLSETFIGRGDTLVLYTDGITESTNSQGEQYGLERLEQLCLEHRRTNPSDIARALEIALIHFTGGLPPDDDRTLVIVKRDP